MEDTFSAAEVRELLAVIADALSPPSPAGYDAWKKRQELLEHRAAAIAGALRPIADGTAGPRDAMHLRGQFAGPLGYEPKPEGGAS